MKLASHEFTSESVSEGHPDKVADQISDAIVDLFLSRDPTAKVAVETLTTTNRVVLAGEVRTNNGAVITHDEMNQAARDVVKRIGYEQDGFHWENMEIANHVHGQSVEIAQGVEAGQGLYAEEGAGDQGIMFGYATNETPELMPATLVYSHQILQRLAQLRHDGTHPELEPDAKSQVTLQYEGSKPVGVNALVVSHQHKDSATLEQLREIVRPVIKDILPDGWFPDEDKFFVNPTGRFVIGGPDGDAGLTGRKIIVDTYGGAAPHGGGAFSGKDPSKVDRSAAYATRYLAKNIVAAGLADRCTIQVSYAIGVAQPLSIYVDTHDTGNADEDRIAAALRELFDLSPKGIRTHLKLNQAIYGPSAAYGHFGRTPTENGGFSWEKTDLVDELKRLAN
ncbi:MULTISPECIES: methionine adenosyltransferase [unclassified Hyphomonas]|jgi:S-adenosylmethionine synthetase|uniref:S-adenosylmethionine synthase n=2 Tax=root TaxID=1 RepID=A0A1Y5I949_OSTTA|nr:MULTISPECIES: methionine adenosyltransferase [unclassified Hyphomonas]MAN91920.1 methionine adenosyltransferase [Hyphomonadaceae bacterium]OUS44744.1 S-adenosylmethionine synthetase [Ostreococcus tauri]MAX83514.1 methionine adenosyltransferase [Hyphomonas sp.]RCL88606.1 MAG: methionine adenosyltransferase [Hyphomonas sp.]HAO34650.1 methionine adenosyltransferase [Hyphomonas sp.]|tara:strand:- start:5772 stop:6953 length:1182 start_codon:yes stop_codon:yes gene_type:complete